MYDTNSTTIGLLNPPPSTSDPYARMNDVDPIRVARDTFLSSHSKQTSPSSDSRPSAFRRAQKDKNTQIPCGRPRYDEEGIPATLLHPVFGQFIDDCQADHKMKEDDNTFVSKLANAMSAIYVDEKERVNALNNVFKSAQLEFVIDHKVRDTLHATDADMHILLGGFVHPYVIAEVKNEAATSSSEPYMQAAAYYLELTKEYAAKLSGSSLPCFLLILFGEYLVSAYGDAT